MKGAADDHSAAPLYQRKAWAFSTSRDWEMNDGRSAPETDGEQLYGEQIGAADARVIERLEAVAWE